jgi:cell wall assembly regulator SMI1
MYDKLYNFLKQINHPVLSSLKKGLTEDKIRELEIKYKINLPTSLKDLYSTYNGVNTEGKTIGELSIFPNGIFLSLEESFSAFNVNTEHNYWEKSYFPICANGDGDFILVQLAPEEDFDRIYWYSPSNTDFDCITSIYDNEFSMINTVIKCYEKGAYFIKSDLVEVNFEFEFRISRPLNLLSGYWTRG